MADYSNVEPDCPKVKVVSLLYLLLIDIMPFGELEQLLRQSVIPIEERPYYNTVMLHAATDLYKRYIEK
jgi:hypothetical protein